MKRQNKRVRHFKQVRAGQWVKPIMHGYRMECCDCGLKHRLNFKVTIQRDGKARIWLQAFRCK